MDGCRHVLNEEDANNLLIMIQPTFDILPQPVLLDSVSIKPNIILLDTFFHMLMFHKETFSQWRKAECQDPSGYKNFEELLEALVTDAQWQSGSFLVVKAEPFYHAYDDANIQHSNGHWYWSFDLDG
ncbi:hypothetical protein EDC04DRAFT_2610195 [Pisolithus marmoratus]|nr:hypothetical protein EDC04DRAFT_2610195 [Pisolithus marmoratus]